MCNLNFGSVPDWLLFVTGLISLSFLKEYVDDTSKIRKISESQFNLSEKNSFEQSVDDHFFNLLNGYYNLIQYLKTENASNTTTSYSGKDCLKKLSNDIYGTIPNGKYNNESLEDFQNRILSIFKPFYDDNSENLSHYFRYLYNFLKYIDESGGETEKYINLLKANISDFEFELIFLNALSPSGKKFKLLIEKYSFFENWFRDSSHRQVFKGIKDTGIFNISAFKKNNIT